MRIAKKFVIVAVIVQVGLMVASFFGGYFTRKSTSERTDLSSLEFIIDTYKNYYLEDSDDYVSIMGNSLLDRYSRYYTADEYEALKQDSVGSHAGIGVVFAGTEIYRVVGNSPAEKAGIQKGGKVTAIKAPDSGDYQSVSSSSEIISILNDIQTGKELEIKILYGEDEKEFALKKSEYQETYVYYSDNSGSYRYSDDSGKMELVKYDETPIAEFDTETAYIRYVEFNGLSNDLKGSAQQIDNVMKKFKDDGKKNLIFDLRSNGGGYISLAQKIAAHLIDSDSGTRQVIAKSIYKDGTQIPFNSGAVDYSSYGFNNIIFLADINSASASELLMGAVLDYDKTDKVKVVLAGQNTNDGYVYRTYGKGIMQSTFEHKGYGDAISLTTAKIYWPLTDTCIHGTGITKSLIGDKCIEAEYGEGDYVLAAALNQCISNPNTP